MALSRVRLETMSVPVRELLPRPGWDVDHLDLFPPYQRASVWSDVQRTNLVRSLIEGLPIGAVFLNDRGDGGPRRVVDGKQRIEAVRAFRAGSVTTPVGWWNHYDVIPSVAGLPPETLIVAGHLALTGRQRVFDAAVAVYVTHLPTVESEQLLYERVNYAGTPPPAWSPPGGVVWRPESTAPVG